MFSLRNVPDLDQIMTALTPETKRAVVIGAGFIGLKWQKTCKTRIRSHSRGKSASCFTAIRRRNGRFCQS